ncbi:MAG: hypothetical protein ACT4OI_09050 [Methanobacteriota archaeon]
MARASRITAEFAFVSAGLLVGLMGWVVDLYATLGAEAGHGQGGGGLFLRLNITFFALGLAAIGVGYEHHERFAREPTWGVRYLAGYLILADGLLHAFAFNDHLAQPFPAAFFGVTAPVQVAVGLALPYIRRSLDAAWLGLLAFLIGAYVATRTAAVWPLGDVEEVESLGILSKIVEVLAVLALVRLIRAARRGRPASTTTPASALGDP